MIYLKITRKRKNGNTTKAQNYEISTKNTETLHSTLYTIHSKKLLRNQAFSLSQKHLSFFRTMFKNIVQNSIKAMTEDNKIIRRTRITSFFHSLIAILLIIINVNSLIAKHYANGLYVGKLTQYFIEDIAHNHVTTILITVTIVIFLAYCIIYPIGQSAIIHYLHNKKEKMKHALQRAGKDFFPMFEFGCVSLVFSPIIWILIAFKLLILDEKRTIAVIIVLAIRLIILSIANNLKAYTRYFITIEKKQLYEALKSSILMALRNRKNTIKYMRVQTILLINFSFNLIVILGIPFLLMYGAIALDIMHYVIVKIVFYLIFFAVILAGSYISAIIRAFFVYYRYEIYLITKKHGK